MGSLLVRGAVFGTVSLVLVGCWTAGKYAANLVADLVEGGAA